MPESDYLDAIRREVRVDAVMNEQMKGAAVSDEEVDKAALENPAFKGLDATDARARARETLLRRRGEERAFEYVEGLKKLTTVKVVARYGAGPVK